MASMIIPPGGFAGFSQMTPASRIALAGSVRSNRGGGTRRRRRKAAKASTKRRAKSTRSKGRKLKFGSPAWRKKFMKKKR